MPNPIRETQAGNGHCKKVVQRFGQDEQDEQDVVLNPVNPVIPVSLSEGEMRNAK